MRKTERICAAKGRKGEKIKSRDALSLLSSLASTMCFLALLLFPFLLASFLMIVFCCAILPPIFLLVSAFSQLVHFISNKTRPEQSISVYNLSVEKQSMTMCEACWRQDLARSLSYDGRTIQNNLSHLILLFPIFLN